MGFVNWANAKAQKLDWLDIGLIKIVCILFGILLVILIPGLIEINIWWLIIIIVLLAIKPVSKIFK